MYFVYFSQNMTVIFFKKKEAEFHRKYDHVPITGDNQRFLLLFQRILIGNQ